ncbi:MAG: hypothetical protein RhofKO_25690 [Rhodothermales bacterium]
MPQDPDTAQIEERYTGFPSLAQHHSEERISLDAHLVPNPTATFYVRVKGHAMTEAGIPNGALLVVDRSMLSQIKTGDVVVAVTDGEPIVRYIKFGRSVELVSPDPRIPPIRLGDVQEHTIWGVATYVIAPLLAPRKRKRRSGHKHSPERTRRPEGKRQPRRRGR